MRPPVRYSDPPPWHDLGDDEFENLCRDLHGSQEHIAECKRYGKRRQLQRGIDLRATLKTSEGAETGQCKCYKEFTLSHLNSAIKEFEKHLAFWIKEKATLFRLYVACEVRDTTVLDAVSAYNQKF